MKVIIMHKLRIKYDINNSLNLDEVYNVDCLCYDINKLLKMNQLVPALSLALLIPDICGQVIFDNNHGKRYCDWFNKYVKKEYRITKEEKEDILENLSSEDRICFEQLFSIEPYYFSGKDCYSLRCNLLHSNVSKISRYEPSDKHYIQENTMSRFGFTLNTNDFDIINPKPIYVSIIVEEPKPISPTHKTNTNESLKEFISINKHDTKKGPYLFKVSISIKNLCLNICEGYYRFYTEIMKDEEKMNKLNNSYALNIFNGLMES